jgi:hypothetical protein
MSSAYIHLWAGLRRIRPTANCGTQTTIATTRIATHRPTRTRAFVAVAARLWFRIRLKTHGPRPSAQCALRSRSVLVVDELSKRRIRRVPELVFFRGLVLRDSRCRCRCRCNGSGVLHRRFRDPLLPAAAVDKTECAHGQRLPNQPHDAIAGSLRPQAHRSRSAASHVAEHADGGAPATRTIALVLQPTPRSNTGRPALGRTQERGRLPDSLSVRRAGSRLASKRSRCSNHAPSQAATMPPPERGNDKRESGDHPRRIREQSDSPVCAPFVRQSSSSRCVPMRFYPGVMSGADEPRNRLVMRFIALSKALKRYRGGGARTPDLRFWRPPLYQLSYTPRAPGV